MPEQYLAFLDLGLLENGAVLRGGCLVTDAQTNPLEFRCTAAIRPSELQRILYGKKLKEYACTELVGRPLLEKLRLKPALVLVRLAEFGLLRPALDRPVILVEKAASGFRLATHPDFQAEIEPARSLVQHLPDLLEPFERVQLALAEAHRLKVGDSKQTTKE